MREVRKVRQLEVRANAKSFPEVSAAEDNPQISLCSGISNNYPLCDNHLNSPYTILKMSESASGDVVAEHDLLPKLIPNLDRHLVYPLLNFVAEGEEEESIEMKKLRFELLKPTNMADFIGLLYSDIHGLSDVPAEYNAKREDVLQRRRQFDKDTEKIAELLDDEAVVSNLRSDKVANLSYLKDNHGVTVDMVNQLYDFGQFCYSCGDYGHAAELLYRFRVLVRIHAISPLLWILD